MGVDRDTAILGSTHKQPKCLQNKGKTNKTIIDLIKKFASTQGKNVNRTGDSIFTQPQYWGSRKQKMLEM